MGVVILYYRLRDHCILRGFGGGVRGVTVPYRVMGVLGGSSYPKDQQRRKSGEVTVSYGVLEGDGGIREGSGWGTVLCGVFWMRSGGVILPHGVNGGGGGYRSLEGQWGPPLQFPVWPLGGAVLNVFLGAFSHRGPAASPLRTAAAQLRPAASSGTDPHRCAEPPAACRDVARASHEHRTPISRSSHTRCTPVLHT